MATPCHMPSGLDGVKFRWLKVKKLLLFQLDREDKKKRHKSLEDADAWEW
jgi:hypothetical protein